ncbi:succinate dehydrogenase assembly factor 2 [Pseudochelatococcus contaminans]|uniref:FAD assembly factor SdhE n=1 Tax=Pseudochelatococcus contaminans TaxID=1538103 RepID=A0A7W5Z2M2_9HYPH|nr:succinate dehydrogenase assembly factor 2 [Pseudochelatococcus contaminans]MBB3808990.1 antitoxin CptB [Pseudochelatococcus contaminans]
MNSFLQPGFSEAGGEIEGADLSDGLALDARRRRIRFRAWHRGTREMDMVLGPFVDSELDKLDEETVTALERLMSLPDRDLFTWFSTGNVPPEQDTPIFRRIKAFHTHTSPVNV